MIDRQTVDRVLAATRIEDLIGDYVQLTKRGANYTGLCPFHNEKTPSFSVSASKGIFKCFGCGKGGNALTFLMEIEHLSFVEAIKHLAKRENITIEEREETQEERQQRTEQESLMIVLQWAQAFYQKQLSQTHEGQTIGLSYLKERGVEPQTIEGFGLGYAPDQFSPLTDAAQAAGYKLDYLVKTGLTIERDGKHYDRFRDRILFPIQTISGRTIAFGGRALRIADRTPKYINSPETPVYHKSSTLFGLSQSKNQIAKLDRCILVEGYLDVLALHQRGLTHALATSGTALTQEQAKIIARFTKNITVLYDGDQAGINAAHRAAEIFLTLGLNPQIVFLPDGQDPDDFAKTHTAQQIEQFIEENQKDPILLKTNELLHHPNPTPNVQAQLTHEILRTISLIPDPILQAHHIRNTAQLLRMQETILTSQLHLLNTKRSAQRRREENRALNQKTANPSSSTNTTPTLLTQKQEIAGKADNLLANSLSTLITHPLYAHERELITLLLHHGNLILYETPADEENPPETITIAAYITDELSNDKITLQHPVLNQILEEFIALQEDPPEDPLHHFLMHPDPTVAAQCADITAKPHTLSRRWAHNNQNSHQSMHEIRVQTEHAMLTYKARILDLQYNELQQSLAQQSDDPDTVPQQLEKLKQLAETRKEFALLIKRLTL